MSDDAAIYVVDDDVEFRSMLGEFLHLEGHACVAFASAEEALRHIERGSQPPPKLVISDVNMGRLTGLDFAREVRRLAPELPIVLMSAFGGREVAADAAAAGADGYLNKPFALPRMTELVARMLEGAPAT